MSVVRPQRSLALILAREFASKLATPMLVVDAGGMIVYFNEAAESVLGQRYSETNLRSVDEMAETFQPTDADGAPIPLEELPLSCVLRRRVPTHVALEIVDAEGMRRKLESTAFPLYAHRDELIGAVAVFWEFVREGA